MIDKKTESDIKTLKGFLELWVKFHSIYSGVAFKENISKEEESKFLDTKTLIKNKYDSLKIELDIRCAPYSRLTDPIDDILQMDTIRLMAERNMQKVADDWRDSFIFLNSILERLNNKKKRLEPFSPAGVFLKRFFEVNFADRLREVIK
jgi:hypothetical protein